MVTDTERREVARRLRDYPAELVAATNSTDNACKYYILDLLECVGLGAQNVTSLFERLADLIEPSEPKVKCVAEVKVDGERLEELVHDAAVELTGIDRDALLALADEIYSTSCNNTGELTVDLIDIWGWAQAICEAVGE